MNINERAAKIKIVITDVDGVLTDGRIIYTDRGDELKFFDVQDGFAFSALNRAGIKSLIITAKKSRVVRRKAKELKMLSPYQNAFRKITAYEDASRKIGFSDEEACYLGDDILDIPIMKKVGFAVAVANAAEETKAVAHYVTKKPGGRGRCQGGGRTYPKERAQNKWQDVIQSYF